VRSVRAARSAALLAIGFFALIAAQPATALPPEKIGNSWGGSCWAEIERGDQDYYDDIESGTYCYENTRCRSCCERKQRRCRKKYNKSKCDESYTYWVDKQKQATGALGGISTFEPITPRRPEPGPAKQPETDSGNPLRTFGGASRVEMLEAKPARPAPKQPETDSQESGGSAYRARTMRSLPTVR